MGNATDLYLGIGRAMTQWRERQAVTEQTAMTEKSIVQWATDRERETQERFYGKGE